MATYGLSRDELRKVISDEFGRLAADLEPGIVSSEEATASLLANVIESVSVAIEQNNALLAQQILEAVRSGKTE